MIRKNGIVYPSGLGHKSKRKNGEVRNFLYFEGHVSFSGGE